MVRGDEERQGEVAQDALRRTLPFLSARPDLDELACEGKVVRADAEIRAKLSSEVEAGARDVGRTGLQAAQLDIDSANLLVELALFDLPLDNPVLGFGVFALKLREAGPGHVLGGQELSGRGHWFQPRLRQQLVEAGELGMTRWVFSLQAVDFLLYNRQPVTPAAGYLYAELS